MTGSRDSIVDGLIARSSTALRERWSADRPVFGLWSAIRDTAVAELVASAPFDFACVDLQHGAATFTELPGMLQAMRAAGRAPFVRVPWNDPAGIMRALDTGAVGVIVPMVSSAAEAAAAVSACRFPPTGTRSWGPMWATVRADGAPPPAEQDAATLCLAMVETRAAIDALADIVRVPGLDGVYIGPNDLALDCGFGRSTYRDEPGVGELIDRVVAACRDAGIVAGLHCSDPEMAAHWADRGVRMLTTGQDMALLGAAIKRLHTTLPRSVENDVTGSTSR